MFKSNPIYILLHLKLINAYMERTSSMKGRGKRSLEDGEEATQEPDRIRYPPLASAIVEALKMDTVQKICSSFEPIIRKVVSEVVERALAKLVPARLEGRSSPPEPIEGLYERNLQLQFKSRLSLPLFTGGRIEGEQSAAIHVVLVDANTGHVVTSGPESSLKLDVIVVEGDFNNEGWGQEEFESHVVNEREGKRPLLTGDLQVTLKEGVGTLGDITFTDNSSWIKSRKFRLGLKVGSGYCERVREAMTEAFTVKDHRGELYRKHYPPALNDDVWRLEKIGKDGSFHKRLKIAGIYSVEDFLRMVVRNPQKLRSILGSGMSNKMWDALIRHSKTCILSGKLYVYYPDDSSNLGVAFNNIFQLSGLIAQDQYYPQDLLSDNQKVCVDAWVEKAYENWGEVVEYDGKSLFNLKQVQKSSMPRNDFPLATRNYSHPLDNQTQPQSFLIPSETSSMDHNILIRGSGYNTNHMIAGYSTESHLINPSSCNEFELTSFTQPSTPNQINHSTYENEVGLALGSFEDWPADCNNGIVNEIFPEEEICMTSNKMLENEDMQQQLLRILNMGGHASVDGSPPEDVFNIPSNVTLPSHGFDYAENQAHPVAGWLKIKSVMRWSIFIRKLVAKNRAHVAELEDK